MFLLLISLLVPMVALQSSPHKRDLDPSWTSAPSQFYRRAFHSSVLLGETLYLDGGDISFLDQDGVFQSVPLNSTYSIDVSTSWTPREAVLNTIDKGDSPILNRPNLWPAPDGKAFYSFNGDVSQAGLYYRDPPASPQLWKFTPNGLKNGSWDLVEVAPSPVQVQSQAATVAFGNNSAYILGGWANWRTTQVYGVDGDAKGSAGGILSYDMDTAMWQNRTMAGFTPSGWWFEGQSHFVTNLGGVGLVIAMGGVTAVPVSTLSGQSLVEYDRVGLFNPLTAVPGDNGIYEIFLHGGSIVSWEPDDPFESVPQATKELDQVWVLSLPSFTWYKSSYEPTNPRILHTCHVPGSPTPRRQMIALGGYIPDLDYKKLPKDHWPQGLGILDLTEMEWKDSYDANAAAYETPKVVKEGIAKTGHYPQTWDDPVVPEWLTGKSMADATNPDSSSPSTQVSSSSSSGTGAGGSNTAAIAGGSNTAAIAGGIAGGLFGLSLLAALAWFIFRKRRLQRKRDQPQFPEKPEMSGVSVVKSPWTPMQGNENASRKLSGEAMYEMVGSSGGHELPGYGQGVPGKSGRNVEGTHEMS